MVEACKAVGLPEPEYGTDGGFVWITFMRPNSITNPDTNPNTKPNTKPSVNHVLAYTFLVSTQKCPQVQHRTAIFW